MILDKLRYLIQHESFEINLPQPSLQRSSAMSYDAHHFLHKGLVRGDFPIPAVHQFLDEDCDDGI